MSGWNERERAIEELYQHDQENQFKALTKAHRSFGRWVADQMSLSHSEAEHYAEGFVQDFIDGATTDALLQKACIDLSKASIYHPKIFLEQEYESFFREAFTQIHDR